MTCLPTVMYQGSSETAKEIYSVEFVFNDDATDTKEATARMDILLENGDRQSESGTYTVNNDEIVITDSRSRDRVNFNVVLKENRILILREADNKYCKRIGGEKFVYVFGKVSG